MSWPFTHSLTPSLVLEPRSSRSRNIPLHLAEPAHDEEGGVHTRPGRDAVPNVIHRGVVPGRADVGGKEKDFGAVAGVDRGRGGVGMVAGEYRPGGVPRWRNSRWRRPARPRCSPRPAMASQRDGGVAMEVRVELRTIEILTDLACAAASRNRAARCNPYPRSPSRSSRGRP